MADGGDDDTNEDKRVAVFEAIGEECSQHDEDASDEVDGDGHDLGTDGCPAELREDGRGEERGGVAGGTEAEVHDDPIRRRKKWDRG